MNKRRLEDEVCGSGSMVSAVQHCAPDVKLTEAQKKMEAHVVQTDARMDAMMAAITELAAAKSTV